jgi:L-threonylcarbamoyladenylate synthase
VNRRESTSHVTSASLLDEAVTHLRQGGVVAVATESSFGLSVDARNPTAIERLFVLKGRDFGKGVALIAPSIAAWRTVVRDVPGVARVLAQEFWPGPLTVAVAADASLDPRLVVDGSVGVRVPGPCVASELVVRFGGVLTATSANLAGEPPLCSEDDVRSQLAPREPELLVLPGVAPGGAPSTVVKVDGAAWAIVRAGSIGQAAIAAALVGASSAGPR